MRQDRHPHLLPFAVACATLLSSVPCRATATLPNDANRPWLRVETALVVWHPDTRTEHLIYAARLEGATGPISVLLQTPNNAAVAPVQADLRAAFSRLLIDYQRRTPHWTLPRAPTGELRSWMVFGDQGKVDALVLQPSDPEVALRLAGSRRERAHAAMTDWLTRYADGKSRIVELRAVPSRTTFTLPYVRLVFDTDEPYFPYREPALPIARHEGTPTAPEERLLRIYVLTTHPVATRTGSSLPTMAHAWLSYEPTFEELRSALGAPLLEALEVEPSRRYWLTSFEDYHATRPGDDDMTFPASGAMPAEGAPGTVGDRAGRGIALEPVGPPGKHAGPMERGTAIAQSLQGRRGSSPPQRRRTGHASRGAWVFGVMVMLALGTAAALAWVDRRNRS